MASAIIVFFIQDQWLNEDVSKQSVPSLALLVESPDESLSILNKSGNTVNNGPTKTATSGDNVAKTGIDENHVKPKATSQEVAKEKQKRFTEVTSTAIGSLVSKNSISTDNLDSVFNWKKHEVIKGDTLWALSERYLSDPFRYPDLARWNHIKNPDRIYPGNIVTYNTSKDAKDL